VWGRDVSVSQHLAFMCVAACVCVCVCCRDHFCQQLDNSTSGIKATIGKLITLLEVHDPQLAAHLSKHKVRQHSALHSMHATCPISTELCIPHCRLGAEVLAVSTHT
jgi:hypothetical protein